MILTDNSVNIKKYDKGRCDDGKKLKQIFGCNFATPLVWRILIALIGGAVIGLVVGPRIAIIEPLGTLVIKLLKMIILSLIFFVIVMGVGSMPASKIGKISVEILLFYFS